MSLLGKSNSWKWKPCKLYLWYRILPTFLPLHSFALSTPDGKIYRSLIWNQSSREICLGTLYLRKGWMVFYTSSSLVWRGLQKPTSNQIESQVSCSFFELVHYVYL